MSGDELGYPRVIPALDVAISPSVRGQANVQDALLAAVPFVIAEFDQVSTIALPPGVLFASGSAVFEAGFYILSGSVVIKASNNNTLCALTFFLDGNQVSDPWTDTPSGGVLGAPTDEYVELTAGPHTFEAYIARAAGTGSAIADRGVLTVTRHI